MGSVLSERLFSEAGEVVAARRSNIKPKNVDMILFKKKKKLIVFRHCLVIDFFVCLFGIRRGAVSYGSYTESPLSGIRPPLIRVCDGECMWSLLDTREGHI